MEGRSNVRFLKGPIDLLFRWELARRQGAISRIGVKMVRDAGRHWPGTRIQEKGLPDPGGKMISRTEGKPRVSKRRRAVDQGQSMLRREGIEGLGISSPKPCLRESGESQIKMSDGAS